MNDLIYIPVQIAVILLAAPLVGGVIKKIKALSQKRKGAPLLQMYFDF
jgi:formate hydrogenlyase subunit 4